MISLFVTIVLAAILIAMLLAPFEALGWWAGWYGEGLREPQEDSVAPYGRIGSGIESRHYVVFLDGIAKVGADNYEDVDALLSRISAALPGAVVLGDVMPYSPRNLALTEGRPLARWWRSAFQWKVEGRHSLLAFSINIRNLLQVMVAADNRYGPIYGMGEAQAILNSLVRAGYRPGNAAHITLIGYSGGSQIAVLAAPFLKRALHVPVSLISLGGITSSSRGLLELDHFYQLRGDRDTVAPMADVFFPGRWPIFAHSYWNRLRRLGKPELITMGPMTHHQEASYLDGHARIGEQSHLDITSETIIRLLEAIDREPDRPHSQTRRRGAARRPRLSA